MADIVNNLFGVDPAALQQQRAATDFAQAFRFAQLDPLERATLSIYQGSAGLGRAANQLLGGDEQLNRATKVRELSSQFDMTSADGLRQFAQAVAPFAPDVAQQAVRRSDEIVTTGLKQTKLIAEARKAATEKLGTPENQAEQAKFTELLAKYPDTVEGRAKAANDFKEWKSQFRQKEAAAGIAPGAATVPDLRTAQSLVKDYLGKSQESLSTIKTINNYGELIKAGNSSQLPQFQRALVKLVGDNQIGQNELKNILGSSGIASDIVDGVAKFITGSPSNAKIDDVLKGVKVLEQQVQQSYRSGQDQARRVLTNSKFDPQIVEDLVGPALKTTPPAGGAKAVPALANWLTQARAANPNVSDAELTAYYNKKYPQPKSK
jgi:hypothetical protein